MIKLKGTIFAAATVAALVFVPAAPATAAGFIGPWVLGRHVIGAIAGLATLPLAVASAALSADQPAAAYPPAPAYDSGPAGYYPPQNYYSRPPAYYAPPSAYYAAPQGYYRPPVYYARPQPRFYGPPRGYYAPRARYSGSYGVHVPSRSGSFAYRRR